jgi:hypothetical protein
MAGLTTGNGGKNIKLVLLAAIPRRVEASDAIGSERDLDPSAALRASVPSLRVTI